MTKVVHVLFSTNRLEYLHRTLQAQHELLDFSNLEVHKIFFDDYPLGRDDKYITNLVKKYNFKEIILHHRNMGITSTWNELFNIVKHRNYDYILHQEDDVEPTEKISVSTLISILKSYPNLSQIQLKRNYWFSNDGPEEEWFKINNTDILCNNYYLDTNTQWFWTLMSLYPKWISEIDFVKETGNCPSEGVVAEYLRLKYNKNSGILKSINGSNLVYHFGELTKGKRVNENEPGWDRFKYYDPAKEYYSRTGYEYRNNSN